MTFDGYGRFRPDVVREDSAASSRRQSAKQAAMQAPFYPVYEARP
jgi:hypothetical protein